MKKLIEPLIPAVLEAGKKALQGQPRLNRSFKADGSILTQFDTEVNRLLCDHIRRDYPEANIISEEADSRFDPDRPYTFTVDPIDGTDSFVQGYPGWCVAVGLLDGELKPRGAVIYAPLWAGPRGGETLAVLEPGEPLLLNGKPFSPGDAADFSPETSQTMISSTLHRFYGIKDYPGRTRYAGCAVLNLLSLILYPDVASALLTPLHIWDLAAAHAVLDILGYVIEDREGNPLTYQDLKGREKTKTLFLAGKREAVDYMKKTVIPLV
jgi:fructose-1,6-bisphosphatase/inositol monophosphatase family enzyme